MSVFLDTSAIIALVDGNETNHPVAQKIWLQLLLDEVSVVTTSYVLTESYALLQQRFGIKALQDMH